MSLAEAEAEVAAAVNGRRGEGGDLRSFEAASRINSRSRWGSWFLSAREVSLDGQVVVVRFLLWCGAVVARAEGGQEKE